MVQFAGGKNRQMQIFFQKLPAIISIFMNILFEIFYLETIGLNRRSESKLELNPTPFPQPKLENFYPGRKTRWLSSPPPPLPSPTRQFYTFISFPPPHPQYLLPYLLHKVLYTAIVSNKLFSYHTQSRDFSALVFWIRRSSFLDSEI